MRYVWMKIKWNLDQYPPVSAASWLEMLEHPLAMMFEDLPSEVNLHILQGFGIWSFCSIKSTVYSSMHRFMRKRTKTCWVKSSPHMIKHHLVGGLVAINSIFPEILGISSAQLTFIFFRGVAQPPTRYGHPPIILILVGFSLINHLFWVENPIFTENPKNMKWMRTGLSFFWEHPIFFYGFLGYLAEMEASVKSWCMVYIVYDGVSICIYVYIYIYIFGIHLFSLVDGWYISS